MIAPTIAVEALIVGGTLVVSACVETRRSLGEDCLKDGDCLSAVCSQLRCAAAPPILGAELCADAGETASPEASGDADGPADELWPDSPGDTGGSDD